MTPDQERELSRLLDSLEKQPGMDFGPSMVLVIAVVALAGGVIGIFIRILIGE